MAKKKIAIILSTMNDVKEFSSIVMACDYEVDLVSGRYAVDAKSIMGVFSLDLTKPICVNPHCSEEEAEIFAKLIERFCV